MSKHTQGPFRIIDLRHQKNGQLRIISEAYPLEGTNEIANVIARNVNAEANARLFSAAPELLEAIKIALRVGVARLCEVEEIDKIEKAIAKAEGE